VEAIVCAAEKFIELARNGLPDEHHPTRSSGFRPAVRAAARLEALLNPDRIPFTPAPALNPLNVTYHRAITVVGWNDLVASGLARLRAVSHDLMANWQWDSLAIGADPETLPWLFPPHQGRLAELDGMEEGLALIRKGLEEEPENPASSTTAEPSEEEQRSPREHAIDQVSVTFGPSPTVTLEGICYSVSAEQAEAVEFIFRHRPAPVTYKSIVEQCPALEHQDSLKIGRDILDKLPEPIRKKIDRKPGKGCTWII
jgi:hypothetical protein